MIHNMILMVYKNSFVNVGDLKLKFPMLQIFIVSTNSLFEIYQRWLSNDEVINNLI